MFLNSTQRAKLEIYKAAVTNGFFNEGADTIAFRGYHIVPEDGNVTVMQGAVRHITLRNTFVAKCWIICRVEHCTLAEARDYLRAAEKSLA